MALRPLARASCVALFCASAKLWAAGVVPDHTLIAALEALRSRGINVIYSSDLVKPEMAAPPPIGRTPDLLVRAREALARYGLALKPMGRDLYAVTLAPAESSPVTLPASSIDDGSTLEPAVVSVYASRYEISRADSGEPRLIDETDIDVIPGTRDDALRAVRMLPGLASNGSTRPYIRGSFVDDVLVQFDGVPLADPFHMKNFQSLVSAFDPEAVERIEVFSGGFPVRYGTKSGGVIDIEPRSVSAGSEYTLGASLVAADASSVGRAERWPLDWLVTLRHSVSDVVLKPVNAHEGEPEFSDSLGRLRWVPAEGTAFTLGWLLLNDRIDVSSREADEIAVARYRDEYGWLAYEGTHGELWRSRTVLSGAWAERSRSGTLNAPGVADERLDEARELESAELRSYWTYAPGSMRSWDLGMEATRARSTLSYDRTGRFTDAVAKIFAREPDNTLASRAAPEVTTYALSAAAHERWKDFEAEVGLRVDAQSYDGFPFRHQVSPRLNLRYDVDRHWRVYGSWGRFTQAQRVDEWRVEEAQTRPDPSALAVHTILGASYVEPGAWRASLEIYRKRWTEVRPYFDNLFDTLSLLPDLQADRVRLAPMLSEAAGAEISVRRTLGQSFETWMGYAYARVLDDFAIVEDVPRSWDQPHAVNGGVAWTQGPWRASAVIGWHNGWPRSAILAPSAGSSATFALGSRNADRWGDYATLDFNVSWTRSLAGGDLTLWADVTNATDRRNACCAHLFAFADSAGTPQFQSNAWLPRAANVGLSWRLRRLP